MIKIMQVEEVDIIKVVEEYSKIQKKIVSKGMNEEQLRIYDIGVKNTISALKAALRDGRYGKNKDRLIYQKYTAPFRNMSQYVRLQDVFKELYNDEELYVN